MGLSVRAFRNVTILSEAQATQVAATGIKLYQGAIVDGFEGHFQDMPTAALLFAKGDTRLFIQIAGPGDMMDDVYDDSCSRYAAWRHQLAGLADTNGTPGDFDLLVKFSDQAGIIGTSACDQLYCAFQRNRAAADLLIGGDFYETYAEFHAAFEFARQGGCVTFS